MVYLMVACFIALDFITGLAKAAKEKNFDSRTMREGLFHKTGSALCVVFGVLVDYGQQYIDIGVSVPVASAICGYIILMECGSIIENIGAINPEIVPEGIRNLFSKLPSSTNPN